MTKNQDNSPLLNGLLLKCPKCGIGSVFSKKTKVEKLCLNCKFPLEKHDIGDGAIYSSMFITAIFVTSFALITELKYSPPLWLHAILWIPMVFITSYFLLILFKSIFIAAQYKFNVDGYRKN